MSSTAELSWQQREEAKFLPDRASVMRQDLVRVNGVLQPRDSSNPWPTIAENIKVAIDPTQSRASEGESGGVVVTEGDFIARFPVGTNLRPKDRIKITTDNNRIFSLVGRRDGSYKLVVLWTCNEIF